MNKTTINTLGWIGVAGVLIAYALLSWGIVGAHDLVYQILNGVGAILLIIESAWRKDYPFTFLNAVWAIIALVVIIQVLV
ncbi:MAG: hypothetical protein V1664_01360 [Candidatus Uhrbacteria bacterium]